MIAKDFLNEMKITVCCDVQKYVITLSEVNYGLKSGWNKLKITFKMWQIKNLTECELFYVLEISNNMQNCLRW